MAAPHKMKAYASFDAFEADQSTAHRAILRALRRLVRRVAPGLEEGMKWGNGCWIGPKGPVAFAHVEPDHVQFGFFHGATLDDPLGLLEGRAKYVRHVKLRRAADIDAKALSALLRQAAR